MENNKEYTDPMINSIKLNRAFVESLSLEEIERLMKPFDDYEIEQ